MKIKKKVIYAACSVPYYVDLAVSLNKKLGWEPCYWIGRKKTISKIINLKFKNVPFHDHHDAISLSKSPFILDENLYPIDTALIKKLIFCEKISIKMMDRFDNAGLMNYNARIKLYYKHISYWSYVLDTLKPDILFNSSAPHQVYDYILYELCKLKKIKTIMLGLGFDLNRLYLKSDIRVGSGVLFQMYKKVNYNNSRKLTFTKKVSDTLKKINANYEKAIPKRVQEQIYENKFTIYLNLVISLLKLPLKYIQLNYFQKSVDQSIISIIDYENSFKAWKYNNISSIFRLNSIINFYKKISDNKLNFSQKFVYVPLSYQPELASSPEGDIFVDQLLMINLISKSIPKDWKIYIKEHPVQFNHYLGINVNVRSINFYKELSYIKNIQFVSMETNPFKLIDKCKAVATITGTSGWEALIRGKPVLHFGYPWWQGCHGSFQVLNLRDCKNAIRIISKNFKICRKKICLFINILEKNSCDGDIFWNSKLVYKRPHENSKVKLIIKQLSNLITSSIKKNII